MAGHGVPSVLLSDHSFVRHLRRYMKPRTLSESEESKSGDKMYLDLDLRRVCSVHILIQNNLVSTTGSKSEPLLKPDIVVIELGCSDLGEPRWETETPSTIHRFQTKTILFCSGYGHCPHYNGPKTHRFENALQSGTI